MIDKVSIKLKEQIYSASKKIIEEKFPDELEYFDIIWEAMKQYLFEWKDISPEKWPIQESYERVSSGLGFVDISQALDLVSPVIITTLSATMIKIKDLGYIPRDEEVGKIIDKYALAFGAKGILVIHMKRYFQDLCRILPEILEEAKEKWKCRINKRGNIEYLDYDKKEKWDKNQFIIWIDNTKDYVHIKNEGEIELTDKQKEFLVLLIKNAGKKIYFSELYINVLGIEVDKIKELEGLRDRIYGIKKNLVNKSKTLSENIKSVRGEGYKAEEKLKDFCIIDFEITLS